MLPFPGPSRRGSNVSLTLDMCTPGCNEEGFGYLMSPREESAREYLLSASRVLQAEELHEKALDPFLLQAEFFVSPPRPATHSGQTLPLTSVTRLARQWSRVSISSPAVLGKLLPSEPQFPCLENGDKNHRMLQGLKRWLTCAEPSAQ